MPCFGFPTIRDGLMLPAGATLRGGARGAQLALPHCPHPGGNGAPGRDLLWVGSEAPCCLAVTPRPPRPCGLHLQTWGRLACLQVRKSHCCSPPLRTPPSRSPLTTSFRPALRHLSVPRHHLKCARTRWPLLKTSPAPSSLRGPQPQGLPLPEHSPPATLMVNRSTRNPAQCSHLLQHPGRGRTLSWCPGGVAQRKQPGS